MKKLLTLSIVIFSLFSCSSNDDNLDPFVGTWYKFSFNNIEVSDCEKKSTVTNKENETYTSTSYYISDNDCKTIPLESGTWTNKGSGIYTIIQKGKEAIDIKIIFKDNNNTFVFSTEKIINGKKVISTKTSKRK